MVCPHPMSESESESEALVRFTENVQRNLEKNGFPERRVAFPIERLYESAYAKGLSFNRVLELLSERGIAHEKTPEKVVFFAQPPAGADAFGPALDGVDLGALATMTPEQQMAAAAEMLRAMSPEQLATIRGMVESLSDEEKADLARRARELGLG